MLRRLLTNKLFSNSATYLASNLASAAIPFALLPVLTRFLNMAEYGEIAMYQTLLTVMTALIGLSVTGAASRKHFDAEIGQGDMALFIGACMQILLCSAGVAFGLIFLLRGALSNVTGLRIEWILLSVWSAAAGFVSLIRMGQWQVRQNPRSYGAFQIGQSALNVLLTLTGVIQLSAGGAGAILSQAIAASAFAGIAIVTLYRGGLLRFGWRPDYIREALGFGVPLIPHTLGYLLLALFDRFMIDSRLGLAQVGVYADPPPLNWSTLKYVLWQRGGSCPCRGSVINPKRS